MHPLDVSVIIPTFNRPDYLRHTLESVLAQTRRPREIIIVDNGDGDGDETGRMLEQYGTAVTYIKIKPAGVQTARNTGIAAATSTWIATLDDDDLYRPTFLEDVARVIDDGRANMIVTDHRKFAHPVPREAVSRRTNAEMAPDGYWDDIPRPTDGQEWSYIGSFPPERLLRYNAFYPSAMVLHKDLLAQLGGYDPGVRGIKAEDMDFTCRALPIARLAFVWKDLVDYRVHQSNTSGDWIAQRFGRWRIFERVLQMDVHGSPALARALEANLPQRRRSVFDVAFLYGRFDVMSEVSPRLTAQDWTMKRRVMRRIASAPTRVTDPLARVETVFHTRFDDHVLNLLRVIKSARSTFRRTPHAVPTDVGSAQPLQVAPAGALSAPAGQPAVEHVAHFADAL